MKDISKLLRKGLSERQVAVATGLSRSQVRKFSIESGYRQVASRHTACKWCSAKLSDRELKRAWIYGKYRCEKCSGEYLHKYQIRKVGCSSELYNKLLESQGGKCGICKAVQGHKSKFGTACRLAVDHSHQTKKVRGLLCNSCNRGLGLFQDSANLLRAAADYLTKVSS